MRFLERAAFWAGIALGTASIAGCSGNDGGSVVDPESVGNVGIQLQIAPGVTVNTVSWSISNATTGFSQSGSVNVQFSNTISFQVGGLPPGAGYTITLSATSVSGAITCTGSSAFSVMRGTTSPVAVVLSCSAAAADAGSIVVSGTTQICANIDSLNVSPLETTVNNPIALSASASTGSVPATFAWTATAGTFDNASSPSPVFTCPSTPAMVTITLNVSPSGPGCATVTSQSVTVNCDTLNPTFTNVYANIIGARCIGCHRPGGSGFTVGGLDMSTQSTAYTNLVGVHAAGTGAGSSGVTCSSVMPALTRVVPSDSANSLLFNKVNAKIAGTQPPCGSPMPLPATAAALTQAQADLIKAWIDGGALND